MSLRVLKIVAVLGPGKARARGGISAISWVADLASGTKKPLLPGFAVTGYDISQDGRDVVFSAADSADKSRIWLAPTDRSTPPQQIPDVEGDMPYFGPSGEVIFDSIEGSSTFAFRVHQDGTGK